MASPSDLHVLRSLLRLARELPLSDFPGFPRLRGVVSLARKSGLLAVIFDDLLRDPSRPLPRSAALCFREILAVLQRCKVLLADCSAWSRVRLLLQAELVANELHELNLDLYTLLDILPVAELGLSDDVRDLVDLLCRQCHRSSPAVDPAEESLRRDMLEMIREIEQEIVPDQRRLEGIFERLGIGDSASCRDEIESLEREIGDGAAENWTAAMVALVGLLRYGKCVLFGASTPRCESSGKLSSETELTVPADFRCPISLELIRDPVVVASGQTYDRESITRWLASGHTTCPKTGQTLAHTNLVPNRALKNLVARWCREQRVPFEEAPEPGAGGTCLAAANKAATEAARMTAAFLVERLKAAPTDEAANRVVHELRQLAKAGAENRAFIADAGAVPLVVPLLRARKVGLQVNAVTALFNLSILDANKRHVMHAHGALDAILHVLADGATWQAKQNAAATLLSLSANHSYRRRLGRNPRVVQGLVDLVNAGPESAKKDALAAILSFASDRENIAGLVAAGVVDAVLGTVGGTETADEAVAVLAALAKRGGANAMLAAEGLIRKLVKAMRHGSECTRENAAAALVLLCRQTDGAAVAKVVTTPSIEWAIWELMQSGTERARRKAAALGRTCRRWLAAQEAERTAYISATNITDSTTTTDSQI